MNKILAIILSLVMILEGSIAAFAYEAKELDLWTDYVAKDFSEGEGTKLSPYVIKTPEELALLAKYVNDEVSYYSNAYYMLGADINLDGHTWMPIGAIENNENSSLGFCGNFDGNGYMIYNMQICEEIPNIYHIGLFGMIVKGIVQNVKLVDAIINFESTNEGWQSSNGAGSELKVGGLCGVLSSKIKNCTVSSILIDIKTKMSLGCGGAIGDINYGDVEGVSVSGSVSAESSRAITVGGVIGSLSNETNVINSSFVGDVSTKSNGELEFEHPDGEGYSYLHYVGGFCGSAGRANSEIVVQNCYAEADIHSVCYDGKQDVGGFAGAIGIIWDKAIYENLVCLGCITVDRGGAISNEFSFWQGEMGMYDEQWGCSEWTYTNCVAIYNEIIYVTSINKELFQQDIYLTSEYMLDDVLFEKLEFDENIWKVDTEGNIYHEIVVKIDYGDVNWDGIINVVDAILIKRKVAGFGDSDFHSDVADVNLDGKINVIDAIFIMRYIAGYDVTLG